MPQDPSKKLAKKAQRKGQRDSAEPVTSTLTPLSRSQPMFQWPLLECLITADWQQPGELVQILIARHSERGEVAAAVVLVDLGCLGVKNAFASRFDSVEHYEEELRDGTVGLQPMVDVDINLAARIVREGIRYARTLGFRPHRDFEQAEPFLRDADPDAVTDEIPLGQDGKPFYINGPNDDPRRIIAQLTRAVGAGNFEYVIGGPEGYLRDLGAPIDALRTLSERGDER